MNGIRENLMKTDAVRTIFIAFLMALSLVYTPATFGGCALIAELGRPFGVASEV
jgi:hypothetical protein